MGVVAETAEQAGEIYMGLYGGVGSFTEMADGRALADEYSRCGTTVLMHTTNCLKIIERTFCCLGSYRLDARRMTELRRSIARSPPGRNTQGPHYRSLTIVNYAFTREYYPRKS